MGSSRENGRGEGSKARPGDPRRRRKGRLLLEALEERRLLSTVIGSQGGSGAVTGWHPSDTNPYDVENGPLANFGQEAIQVYHDYENYVAAGSKGAFYTAQSKVVMVNGVYLDLDIRATGSLSSYETELKSMGMYITATNSTFNEVEGYFPLANMVELASSTGTIGGLPV